MKNIGIIGCGAIGRLHAKNLRQRAKLTYCSRSPASAERFATEFGGSVCPSFEALLERPELDAVIISSPPQYHCDQVVAALRAGKAVLAEKPLCVSPEEVERIGVAVAASDAFLMVAENYYYKPSLALIKEWAAAIGPIRKVYAQKLFTQASQGWKSGYGALLEGGVHFVALVADLFDCVPDAVEAEFPGHVPGQPERHAVLQLNFGAAVAELRYAWDQPSLSKGLLQYSYLEGEAGRIIFESNGLYVRCGGRWRLPWRDLMGYGAMTDDLLSCLETPGRRPYSDFERARRDLGIVFSAYAGLQQLD
jgi:predicted dehydrogenase